MLYCMAVKAKVSKPLSCNDDFQRLGNYVIFTVVDSQALLEYHFIQLAFQMVSEADHIRESQRHANEARAREAECKRRQSKTSDTNKGGGIPGSPKILHSSCLPNCIGMQAGQTCGINCTCCYHSLFNNFMACVADNSRLPHGLVRPAHRQG
ncbi:uncharacterized protein LOC142768695 isoform X2 [Rhipicephalus microplus]|uniref:uncharacterized protein LOC142768695 isoform X2 n=1 Tax=Rhipicephalus microplus TaxID=6941 RepID=UPI003F6C330C